MGRSGRQSEAWEDEEQLKPSNRPLTAAFAGACCQPWSRIGARGGMTHPATEPWLIWKNEMQSLSYDFTHLENSDMFPIEAFSDGMDADNEIVYIRLDPSIVGWPVSGARLLATALRRETLIWAGPSAARREWPGAGARLLRDGATTGDSKS